MAATVEIVFRKDKMGMTDEAPLHVRITKNRRVQYIATGHKLHKRYWDSSARKVKRAYPNSSMDITAYSLPLISEHSLPSFQSKVYQPGNVRLKLFQSNVYQLIN